MASSIDWPGTLPEGVVVPTYQRESWALDPRSAIREHDYGLIPRRRQIYGAPTGEPEYLSVTWMFTPDGEIAFRRFFKYDLGMGAAWFNMPLFLPDATVETREVKFLRESPVLQPYTDLFTRVSSATLITRAGLAPEAE